MVAALVAAVPGCSSSAPAQRSAPPTADVLATPSASAAETLLPTAAPTGSTVGALAAGFPADLVVVPPGAEVLVSAAEPVPGGDLLRVSLNLRSAQDTAGLVEALRAPLLAAGFAETAATPEPGLAARTAFSRGDGAELLVLGVLDTGTTRTLTVGGTVRAPSAG